MSQIALFQILRCAVGENLYLRLIMYDFTRFMCTENHTPQDQFRSVTMCHRTEKPQKARPAYYLVIGLALDYRLYVHITYPGIMQISVSCGSAKIQGLFLFALHCVELCCLSALTTQ